MLSVAEPILERSAVIEGDVLLYKQRKHRNRAIPLMSAPSKIADRITFKEWLREVSKLRKGTTQSTYAYLNIKHISHRIFSYGDRNLHRKLF